MTEHSPSGADAVRSGIKGAEVVQMRPVADDAPLRDGKSPFVRLDAGIFRRRGEDGFIFLCGPVDIVAETKDQEGNGWGLLLRWKDRDGVEHEEAFSRSLLVGDGNEVRSRLADGGLSINPAAAAKSAFLEWLASLQSNERALTVSRIGWHGFGDKRAFVLPDATIGDAGARVVLQSPDREPSLFNVSGTVKKWRDTIGAACKGNSRLIFAASCAFAAPLLEPLGEEGGGISFKGASRLGKSTALRVAASVCGGTPQGGAGGFLRSWRSTGNAIESIALSSCDCLLTLDEMGQLDPKEAGEVAYMLANGQGKARSGRSGSARPVARFRILFLSTGELGLSDLNREAGKMTKAGQEVRFADLPADAERGYGLFDTIHHADSANDFARYLKVETGKHYGAPFRAFLQRLTEVTGSDNFALVQEEWRERINELTAAWLKDRSNVSGQVLSVAARFAMVALAGELATKFGITGWDDDTPSVMAEICFRAWLRERGTVGRREEEQAVASMRDFISRHGVSRFEIWADPRQTEGGRQSDDGHLPPANPRFAIQNRAGWRRWVKDDKGEWGWHYYLTPEAMDEALSGLNKRCARSTLLERGFLIHSSGPAIAGSLSPPGHPKIRLYHVLDTIMASAAGDR
jgi:putative DNA primase/helicase